MDNELRDVFLSHASQDKEIYVRPLAQELDKRGISYWLDEAEIGWGDKITQKINDGLKKSQFVIVFLSQNFLGKNWPEAELGAALHRENSEGKTVVLPLVIGDAKAILQEYPLLRDKSYLTWDKGVGFLAERLEKLIPNSVTRRKSQALVYEATVDDIIYFFRFGRRSFDTDNIPNTDFNVIDAAVSQLERLRLDYKMPVRQAIIDLPSNVKDLISKCVDLYDSLNSETNTKTTGIISTELPSDGSLEILHLTANHEAELDVKLRNTSNDTIYITRIRILLMKDWGAVSPILRPSAKYKLPIGSLNVGESKSLDVSHIIEPHKADRFLIALSTTRVLLLRLTLEYNKYYSISENIRLWL